jgi:hypothetical protein
MTNIANIPKTTPKMMQQGMITAATRRMLICMGLLCRILALGTSPQARMADITAEAAAKRPFDQHRLAVLMVRIFSLEEPEPISSAREPIIGQVIPSGARNA